MRYTWLFILPPLLILGIIFVAWYRYRLHSDERDLKHVAVVAHTKTIKMLPAYKKAMKRYRLLLIFAAVSFLISIFSFTAVAARPVTNTYRETEKNNRDIILCLDISGSMTLYQKVMLDSFTDFINEFKGERIGVTVFDGVPANIIPLSDDYGAVNELMNDLKGNTYAYNSVVSKNGNSAIGDGLVGCVQSFSSTEDDGRSKSIILATDNNPGSSETIDIEQAARYAKRYGITVYGLSSTESSPYLSNGRKFENATSITGGAFYHVARDNVSNSTIKEISKKILSQDAARIAGAPEIIHDDNPTFAMILSAISFTVFLVLIWRLRL